MNSKIQVAGHDGNRESAEDIKNAHDDMKKLVAGSKIISSLLAVSIISSKLHAMAHESLEIELREGWEVTNPELVMKLMLHSGVEAAAKNPGNTVQLRQELFDTVIPVVDIFCKMENEKNERSEESTVVVPGDDLG